MNTASKPLILAFGPGTWRWPEVYGSTRLFLWYLAGRGWRIVYTEPPVRFRRATTVWRSPDRPFSVVAPGMTMPFAVRATRGETASRMWRSFSSAGLARAARKGLALLDERAPDMFWFGAPWHGSLSRRLPTGVPRVVYTYDELAASPALSPAQQSRLWKWERDLHLQADLSLCLSQPILERRKGLARNAVRIGNCVPESFLPEKRGEPPQQARAILQRLRALPRPRLIYGGTVDLRMDVESYRRVLEELPEAQLVLLGKVGLIGRELQEFFQSHPRVHLFGAIPNSAYPHLYGEADCLLIAHQVNDFTRAMYPSKLLEYLASGRPVAAISLPEIENAAKESGEPRLVYTALSSKDFPEKVSEALKEKNAALEEKRIAFARSRSGPAVAEKLESLFLPFLEKKLRQP